jgi:diguanylate cyclase (GGDEF)-like protein/PAS domain S-box-containing protein
MTHAMIDLLLSFLFLIPSFFLMNTALEIFNRNRKHAENILASLKTFFIALMFFFEYIVQISLGAQALTIAIYGVYPAALLSAGTSVMLHFQISRLHHHISKKLVAVFSYFPLVAYFAVLITFGKSFLFSGIIEVDFWKVEILAPFMLLLSSTLFLYFIFNTSVCVGAWRRSIGLSKKRYSFLIRANVCCQTFSLLIIVLAELPNSHIPSNIALFSSLVWGIALRILMIKYDFLPSIERKFELLYQLSPVSILLLDKNGVIMEANPSAEKLLGANPGDLTDVPFAEFIQEGESASFLEQYISDIPKRPWTNKEFVILNRQHIEKTLIADMEMLSGSEEWYVFAMLRDITTRKEEEKYIAHLAHHDALTQLPNRLFYKLKLEQSFEAVRRNGGWLAVMLIDLDRFKMINDTLGHQQGDEALLVVADRLNKITGANNLVARLGGDEFIILMPAVAEFDEIIQLAEDILNVFQIPVKLLGHDFFLNGSMGISIHPGNGDDPSSLIRQADIAMYQAKSSGGNQYRLYKKEMDNSIWRSSEMEIRLRKAMERNELSLHYQPQYAFADGSLTGMEALIRWNSKELGSVPPSEFIPVAEHTGMIIDIGKWVMKEACHQAVKWMKVTPFVMSVNISSRQFMQPDFVAMVEEVLRTTGIEPQYLCLEVTESTVINNLDVARKMLDELVDIGIKIAIDDFGTGYSSLSVLKQLPLSIIKIDRSFIQDMGKDDSIVKAIISMGHDLGKEIVAEGVEDILQYERLKALRCYTGQGYLMSKPLPVEAVQSMLTASIKDFLRSIS